MRKKLLFAVFLAIFVLFGGGRSGNWTIVCRDEGGWTYEVDLHSLHRLPSRQLSCQVRTRQGDDCRQALWVLDTRDHTLAVSGGPAQTIQPGSVAFRVLRFLSHQEKDLQAVSR